MSALTPGVRRAAVLLRPHHLLAAAAPALLQLRLFRRLLLFPTLPQAKIKIELQSWISQLVWRRRQGELPQWQGRQTWKRLILKAISGARGDADCAKNRDFGALFIKPIIKFISSITGSISLSSHLLRCTKFYTNLFAPTFFLAV